MPKFFCTIRQNLIVEHKTSKYLKYAIGEIILVFIGNLMALFINNRNEIQKSEGQKTRYLYSILLDLEEDVL